MGVFARRSGAPTEVDGDPTAASSTSRFASLWSRPARLDPGRQAAPPVEVVPPDGLKPSAMRRPEPLYGYVVGLELLVVAILNMTVTHGKGAPAHPQTTLAAVGVVASIAYMAVVYYTRNRMAAGFGAIVAAFFVTLPRVPNSMALAHIFALVIPMAFGLIITQRQRRDTPKLSRRGGAGQAPAGRSSGRSAAAPATRRGRRGKAAEPVTGPRPSARYTPPKSKRQASKK